ncbi:MAG: hypothetical protein ACFE85_17605 [Candidatus Hodarchaeota archaeon]
MSISNFDKTENVLIKDLDDIKLEHTFNLSDLVVPFSRFFKNETPLDIYTGKEKIPFHEKDSEFKSILIQEFL